MISGLAGSGIVWSIFLMKYCFLLFVLIGATVASAQAQTVRRVADPTPSPLNVRTSPNGRVVGTLENRMVVAILDRTTDRRGQAWVYVGNAEDRMPIGWVFRDYVDCRPERTTRPTIAVCRVADPTPTPLNVRTSPNGRVVGTIENGMMVLILDRRTDRKRQVWVYIGNADDQMPIGWVFRDYIDCRSNTPIFDQDLTKPINCNRATIPAELAVCMTPNLRSADTDQAQNYIEAREVFAFNPAFLRRLAHDRAEWLEQRNACGNDVECLKEQYAQWAAELGDLDIVYCEMFPHEPRGCPHFRKSR
jgi:Bacterial SH3 domain